MRVKQSKPTRLRQGDKVRLVSPGSTPDEDAVARSVQWLEDLGFQVELGRHVFDRFGYLAGRDEDRLADLNNAFNDCSVRAVIATGGGKGAYRIADGLDFPALRADPKLLIGFSEITILHLAIWQRIGIPGIHGACWDPARFGETSSESFRRAIQADEPVIVRAAADELTSVLTRGGQARGVILGGNLDMIATAAGWVLPNLEGAILLIEDVNKGLGHIDRLLTRLLKAGHLKGIAGIAIGQFTGFEDNGSGWTIIDVLRDRLAPLGVPILGGLPLGHGNNALAIPIGMPATLDSDKGVLMVESAVASLT